VHLALRYLSRSGAGIEETMYLGATATYSVRQGSVRKVPVISRIEGGTPLLTRIEDRAR
jgi:hypothetical protein